MAKKESPKNILIVTTFTKSSYREITNTIHITKEIYEKYGELLQNLMRFLKQGVYCWTSDMYYDASSYCYRYKILKQLAEDEDERYGCIEFERLILDCVGPGNSDVIDFIEMEIYKTKELFAINTQV